MKQQFLKSEYTNRHNFVKREGQNYQFGSPRFARKKDDDQHNFWAKKTAQRSHGSERICYISPKKIVENSEAGSDSYQSLIPTSNNFNKQQIFGKNNTFPEEYSYSANNLSFRGNLQNVNQAAKDRVAKTKTVSQQNYQLKKKNSELTQLLLEKSTELNKSQAMNNDLVEKLNQLNNLISNKDIIIKRLQESLHQSQNTIQNIKFSLSQEKHTNQKLRFLIDNMYKQGDSCVSISSETEDDEKQRLQKEVHRCNNEIIALSSKLKYQNLQESMYQKLKFDLEAETQKNERLKTQNRKLLLKLETLVKEAERKVSFRWRQKTPLKKKDSEISLELSPQKSQK